MRCVIVQDLDGVKYLVQRNADGSCVWTPQRHNAIRLDSWRDASDWLKTQPEAIARYCRIEEES